jgi:hypothetical protein
LVWAGNPGHANDHRRSIPRHLFTPLIESRPDTTWVSLQVGATDGGPTMLDAGPDLRDFADTAALIAALDLVITVDTAVAHLAGAMGKPTWLLLPFSPDWRWMLGRDDTPWYPSVRLFRQPTPGDWPAAIAQATAALASTPGRPPH